MNQPTPTPSGKSPMPFEQPCQNPGCPNTIVDKSEETCNTCGHFVKEDTAQSTPSGKETPLSDAFYCNPPENEAAYEFACSLEARLSQAEKELSERDARIVALIDENGAAHEHYRSLSAAHDQMSDTLYNRVNDVIALRARAELAEELAADLDKVHSLLRAMPDAPTASTDVSFDKWRLYADALGICRSAIAKHAAAQNGGAA